MPKADLLIMTMLRQVCRGLFIKNIPYTSAGKNCKLEKTVDKRKK